MKYRLVFTIFNVIIISTFLIVSFLPAFILGWDYMGTFWERSWLGPILFLVILIILDSYFIRNWKFFGYLEVRDWTNIQKYLDNEFFRKKRIDYPRLLILLNTYLIQGNMDDMFRLSDLVKERRPRLFKRIMAALSTAYLLNKDYDGLTDYFQSELKEGEILHDGWPDWLWAFGMLRKKEIRPAGKRLLLLALKGRDEMVRLLALYVLIDILEFDVPDETCQNFLMKFRNKYSPASWVKNINNKKDQLHILLLCDFIQQAGEWCIKDYQISLPIASATPENLDASAKGMFEDPDNE